MDSSAPELVASILRRLDSKKNSSAPNAGRKSSSHEAEGSKRAKKGRLHQFGSRAWRNESTNTSSPATSATPSITTLPGSVDMVGPRAVRARPDPQVMASE